MPARPRCTATALVLLALLLVGCQASPTPEEPTTPGTTGDGETPTPTAASVDAAPSGRLELTGWQQTHPGATSVAVHAIEVDADGFLSLDIEVATGKNDIKLARFSTYLLDDLDVRHDLIPPDDNPELAIPADSRVQATLAFDEPIADDATHVTFAINGVGSRIVDAEDDSTRFSSGPKMAFRDLPLPGLGLDDEADRGETLDLVDEQSIDLEITQTHPTGVVVTVTRIATDTRSVHLDIEVDNPTDREVRILSRLPHLYDGPQQTSSVGAYQWAEIDDQQVRKLDIPAGGEASATLAFRGTIDPDAADLELTLNGGADDDPDARSPGFTFADLPIPGRDQPTPSPSPDD